MGAIIGRLGRLSVRSPGGESGRGAGTERDVRLSQPCTDWYLPSPSTPLKPPNSDGSMGTGAKRTLVTVWLGGWSVMGDGEGLGM